MAKKGRVDESREPGGYCALPWCVIDSQAYQNLNYPAVALLIELARQYVRNNNGRLLLSENYLKTRQWRSKGVIEKARRDLLDAKLIYQTVQGHRPNKASWYALTWYTLDKLPGYDAGAVEGFRRGMYAAFQPLTPAPTREALFKKWRGHGNKGASKINMLTPDGGVERVVITPDGGVERLPTTPDNGVIRALLPHSTTPANGHHLDKPFCTGESLSADCGGKVAWTPTTTAQTVVNDHDIDGGQIDRVRERDLDPAMYDPNTGEFCAPQPAPAPAMPDMPVNEISEAPALHDTHDLDQIDAGQVVDAPFIETTTRHRDCDQTPDRYDPDSGDFMPIRPPVARRHRQTADDWVNGALASKPNSRVRDACNIGQDIRSHAQQGLIHRKNKTELLPANPTLARAGADFEGLKP